MIANDKLNLKKLNVKWRHTHTHSIHLDQLNIQWRILSFWCHNYLRLISDNCWHLKPDIKYSLLVHIWCLFGANCDTSLLSFSICKYMKRKPINKCGQLCMQVYNGIICLYRTCSLFLVPCFETCSRKEGRKEGNDGYYSWLQHLPNDDKRTPFTIYLTPHLSSPLPYPTVFEWPETLKTAPFSSSPFHKIG